MKLGFDAKRLYNNFTGLGNYSRTTIDILTAEYPDNDYYLYSPKVRLNGTTLPYIGKRHCHTVTPKGIMRGSAWRTYGLVNDMKRDGIELFHGLSNEMPTGLFHSGIASVVTIHDVAFRTFPSMYHWHDRKIYDLKWQYTCNHSDRIVAISECTKRDIMEFYDVPEHKIDVVYQPVSPIYYTPLQPTPTNPYMLYVGSINSRKNLLGVVKAIELLPRDLRMPLVIVGGGGSYKQTVRQYIADHGLDDLFLWPEMVGNTDLKRLYTNATLFVYPSFYEGFGLPVVEAQLCGCPVVTSNISSLPEAGGPFAQQADPNSPEDIRDKIQLLLTDTELIERTRIMGRQRALQTFDPVNLARQLMGVYKSIL